MNTVNMPRTIILTIGMMMLFSIGLSAQKMTVSGTVTAENKKVLPGVTVVIKGTLTGTTTNREGRYSIMAQKGDVINFQFIGYQTFSVQVKDSTLNVVLKEDKVKLEEVVVTGQHQRTTKQITGSVQSVQTMTVRDQAQAESMALERNVIRFTSPVISHDHEAQEEEYSRLPSNAFRLAWEHPLSTFSLDVDAASYSNIRRFINNGQLPPPEAVRTEEMINYFTYDYPAPRGKDPVSITTEVAPAPWNTRHRLVHIGIKAREVEKEKLPPSNLVFLIDVSGSMDQPNKLPLLKSSLKLLVSQLRKTDRVSIVTYANNVREYLPSTSGEEKEKINAVIESLHASGGTAGGAGIQTAYRVAKQYFIKEGNNRVILATDGDFNIGISRDDELEKFIEKERQGGVFLTVLGFGMGNYKDKKMQVLAEKGNGNHAYIDNIQEAKRVLVNEFSGSLFTIAKDVKLQIEFNPAHVKAYRLIGYESRMLEDRDFNDDTKDAGEIGVGHTVTALYEVIPVGVESSFAGETDPLKYQKSDTPKKQLTGSPEMLTVKLRYKQPSSDTSAKMEVTVTDSRTTDRLSANFRFSAAVAGFGMLLQDSPYKNNLTFDKVLRLARQSVGEDPEGYRREFIRLVESAALLK